ncbi:MAG: hypothetical protein RLZZ385_925 [Pseudomonadota bacterium]|jgi:transcriptional regulator GlxA family with amidase domain
MKRVALLALDQALGTSITIPLEMLSAARSIARARQVAGRNLVLQVVGLQKRQVTLKGGLVITPDSGLKQAGNFDLVFIPGLWRSPSRQVRAMPRISRWLRAQYEAGAILCSIGTGSYFLAEAGLLDGRMATTHWFYFDDFAARFPAVGLQRKRFITLEDRLYCTGSVNAARDVMLHFVEQLFSNAIANEVARHFTHEVRRSYESMLLDKLPSDTHHDELIIKVQEWLQVNFQQAVKLQDVARRFKLSPRSLNRRFRAAANTTPLHYLQEIRISQAKELLKRSNLGIAEIGFRVGYQDTSYFGALFRRLNAVSPAQYRNLVRNKLFQVEEA